MGLLKSIRRKFDRNFVPRGLHGRFWMGGIPCWNNITEEGSEAFLRMLVRADDSDVGPGGDFFVGLMGSAFAKTTTLATLAGEPSGAGAYARQPITRDATGWPNIDLVNGVYRAASVTINFIGSGAPFSTSISRAFLCDVVSGSAGLLYSIGGALPQAKLVASGETYPVRYELFLR